VSAAVDSSGTLYSVWQVSPGAGSEIHFQKRPSSGRPTPRDTTLDSFGDGLQNPRLALDATGGIHVAYERSVSSGQQIRYKRWNSSLGWDHRATEVTEFNAVLASGINLLPTSSGNVDVIWIAFDGNVERLRERARFLDGSQVTDVPEPAPQAWPALSAGPNPLRAGQTLEFAGDGVQAGAVIELIDAAGRRVAAVTADAAGRARLERDATAPLAAGLYFVRVRGSDVRGRVVVLR